MRDENDAGEREREEMPKLNDCFWAAHNKQCGGGRGKEGISHRMGTF